MGNGKWKARPNDWKEWEEEEVEKGEGQRGKGRPLWESPMFSTVDYMATSAENFPNILEHLLEFSWNSAKIYAATLGIAATLALSAIALSVEIATP